MNLRIIILLIGLFQLGFAHSENKRFNHISLAEGLPNAYINAIAEDAFGYIWLGTNGGLFRYDGHSFISFRDQGSISLEVPSSSYISRIVSGGDGLLWIATLGGGVKCFDTRKEDFVEISYPNDERFLSVYSLFVENNQSLWVGTEQGLGHILVTGDGLQTRFFHIPFVEQNEHVITTTTQYSIVSKIAPVEERSLSRLLIGTYSDTYLFDIHTQAFTLANTNEKSSVRDIISLGNGEYLAGFWNAGVSIIHPENKLPESAWGKLPELLQDEIRVLTLLKSGSAIYIGTEQNGLYVYNKEHPDTIIHYSTATTDGMLQSNSVGSLFVDHEGILWAGHLRAGGLTQILPEDRSFSHVPVYGDNTSTTTQNMIPYDEHLIITTVGAGIKIYNPVTNHIQSTRSGIHDNSLPTFNDYHTGIRDSHGHLWLGSKGNGLEFIHAETISRLSDGQPGVMFPDQVINNDSYPGWFSNFIMSVYEDRQGRIWAGTWRGIFMVPNHISHTMRSGQAVHLSFGDIQTFTNMPEVRDIIVFTIQEHPEKGLLLGTRHDGLVLLQEQEQGWVSEKYDIPFQHRGVPAPETVNSMLIQHDTLLIAANTGVYKIDVNTDRILLYAPIEQFDYMEPMGITVADHYYWITTSYGIYQMDIGLSEVKRFIHHVSDKANQYNYNNILSFNSQIYAGSFAGLSRIDLSQTHVTGSAPALRIAAFSVNNQQILPGRKHDGRIILRDNINHQNKVVLRSRDNYFTIDLALMDYHNPDLNKFFYMLEGVHEDFIQLNPGQRSISFTNLKPGDYTLALDAVSSNGIKAANPIELSLKILPVWYFSRMALLGYGLIITWLIYLFIRFRLDRERHLNQIRLERLERKKTEELSQHKIDFFSDISHELRTPLTLITAPLEKLVKTEVDPRKQKNLHMMYQHANRLLVLLDQILDLRRIDHGQLHVSKHKGDIVGISRKVFSLFELHAKEKNMRFCFQTSHERVDFAFDPFIIETILYNLLSNAVKFIADGDEVCLNLRYSENQDLLEIEVVDTGPGVPKKQAKYIFDRFYKGEDHTDRPRGHGIGLALCRELIHLHGGDIKLQQPMGKGCCFLLTLHNEPAETAEHPDRITDERTNYLARNIQNLKIYQSGNVVAAEAYGAGHEDKSTYSVLLIDDNNELLQFLQNELSAQYKVMIARDAEEALKLLEAKVPDIIVSDVMMPGMDGTELTQKLKSDPRYSFIPIILLTAKPTDYKQEAIAAGADAFITKPFRLEHLILRIRKILESKQKMRDHFAQNVVMSPTNLELDTEEQVFIATISKYIELNIDDVDFTVDKLAEYMHMSRAKLYRKADKLIGMSVKELIRDMRMQRAAELLATNSFSVTEVSYRVGIINTSYFIKCFQKKFGKTPREYMQSGIKTKKVVT